MRMSDEDCDDDQDERLSPTRIVTRMGPSASSETIRTFRFASLGSVGEDSGFPGPRNKVVSMPFFVAII